MSIVYQADVFCDGESDSCALFICQGQTYTNTTVGVAVGAWSVAKANGWTRSVVDHRFFHYCPVCTAKRECEKDAHHG